MLDTSDDVVCTIGASPATVMVSCTVESRSEKLISARWPALKTMSSRTALANPVSSTCTRYRPSVGSDVIT